MSSSESDLNTKRNVSRVNGGVDKKTTKPRLKYSIEALNKAIEECRGQTMTTRSAATEYQVPLTTLRNWFAGKSSSHKTGVDTLISSTSELDLVSVFKLMLEWGWGVSFVETQEITQQYLIQTNQASLLNNGKLGMGWHRKFLRRHKDKLLVHRNHVNKGSSFTCTEIIERFFSLCKEKYSELGLHTSPGSIWCADEAKFSSSKGRAKTIASKGSRSPIVSSDRSEFVVQSCCNAAGEYLSPYIVFKEDGVKQRGAACSTSPSGWMELDTFAHWFSALFVPRVSQIRGAKILYLDGNFTHLSLDTMRLALNHDISLISLPRHTSSVLQVFNKGVYGHARVVWREVVNAHYGISSTNVNRFQFIELLRNVYQKAFRPEHAIEGFRCAGLFPLNVIELNDSINFLEDRSTESLLALQPDEPETMNTDDAQLFDLSPFSANIFTNKLFDDNFNFVTSPLPVGSMADCVNDFSTYFEFPP